MDKIERENIFIGVLEQELVPALGCTEPIAIAYASARARQVLGCMPEKMVIRCSGNIIKNVMGVTVPNSDGMKGIESAATLGVVGGSPDRELEVLEAVTEKDIQKTNELVKEGFCTCSLQPDVENLYIVATVYAGEHSASVTIVNRHTLITQVTHDGEIVYSRKLHQSAEKKDYSKWSIKDILEFADTVDVAKVRSILDRQINYNLQISEKGISEDYGAQVGRTLLEIYGDRVEIRARAGAAAGSDARMGGCSLPVVINSGSGNQGMTVSIPVVEFARAWRKTPEELYRALLVSNLIAIYQKSFIGSLSAFCGAVTAAAGVGAALSYLSGGSYEEICQAIVNTLGNVGGIVCDGAKSSCAAKISSAVDAAILAFRMSRKNRGFHPGEGIVKDSIEGTVQSVGRVARDGMKETDTKILSIMLEGNSSK